MSAEPAAKAEQAAHAEHAASVASLTKRFGDFTAVDAVSFHVERGEIFGYLGANGAGKSTTIRMLCGLLEPTDGRAWVNGIDVAADPEAVKRSIGYMSQKFSLYMDLTVEENLEFFGGAYGRWGRPLWRRIDALLERLELAELRKRMTRELPGGTRQRLALASALLHEPRMLFLDEPTAAVAPRARRHFWRLIRELAEGGTTVFVTTHYMDEAEYCHRIGMMVDGELVALDTPAALKRDHVPGLTSRVEQPGVDPGALAARVAHVEGVLAAQPFGAALHVRYDPQVTAWPALRAALGELVTDSAEVSEVEATLEDVFLALAEPAARGDTGNGGQPHGESGS